ncbi:hypothetical protein [Clostridium saccharoperbutylacetonicum]
MINKKSWNEFRDNGFLWWINMILHAFGWVIAVKIDDDGNIIDAYPARTNVRGFPEEDNTEGYIKLSKYMNDNAAEILKESQE